MILPANCSVLALRKILDLFSAFSLFEFVSRCRIIRIDVGLLTALIRQACAVFLVPFSLSVVLARSHVILPVPHLDPLHHLLLRRLHLTILLLRLLLPSSSLHPPPQYLPFYHHQLILKRMQRALMKAWRSQHPHQGNSPSPPPQPHRTPHLSSVPRRSSRSSRLSSMLKDYVHGDFAVFDLASSSFNPDPSSLVSSYSPVRFTSASASSSYAPFSTAQRRARIEELATFLNVPLYQSHKNSRFCIVFYTLYFFLILSSFLLSSFFLSICILFRSIEMTFSA